MLTLDSHLTIPSHVTSTRVDDDNVLLNTRTNQYFALEEVASRMWSLLRGGQSLRGIHGTLLKEYEVESAELESDLLELVHQLVESNLLEVDEG